MFGEQPPSAGEAAGAPGLGLVGAHGAGLAGLEAIGREKPWGALACKSEGTLRPQAWEGCWAGVWRTRQPLCVPMRPGAHRGALGRSGQALKSKWLGSGTHMCVGAGGTVSLLDGLAHYALGGRWSLSRAGHSRGKRVWGGALRSPRAPRGQRGPQERRPQCIRHEERTRIPAESPEAEGIQLGGRAGFSALSAQTLGFWAPKPVASHRHSRWGGDHTPGGGSLQGLRAGLELSSPGGRRVVSSPRGWAFPGFSGVSSTRPRRRG